MNDDMELNPVEKAVTDLYYESLKSDVILKRKHLFMRAWHFEEGRLIYGNECQRCGESSEHDRHYIV